MRVVLQRVTRAEVRIDERISGRIGRGMVLLVGFHRDDTPEALTWMAEKVTALRVFPDDDRYVQGTDAGGRSPEQTVERPSSFSRDVGAIDGGVLVVSQFTLYADTSRGRRPGFADAAPPAAAVLLYDRFVELLRERAPGRIATGEFGAMMHVELVNDGPVTLILER